MQESECYKDWIRDVFDGAASSYGKKGCSYFEEFGKALVSKTNIGSGQRILDIATGKGAILLPAAKVVGKNGSAIGIDISPEMISECSQQQIPSWVKLLVMDGENLKFSENHFDLVFCGFGIFFLPEINRALAEIKRVLKSNGQLAISIWGKTSNLTQWVVENAKQFGSIKHLKHLKTYSNDNDFLKTTLKNAGFTNVEIYDDTRLFWHDNAEEWWNSLWTHAIRAYLEQLETNDLNLLREKALQFITNNSESGRIQETLHAIYAICHKE